MHTRVEDIHFRVGFDVAGGNFALALCFDIDRFRSVAVELCGESLQAENIFLYGAMLGYSKKFLESKFDEIVEFSELKEFIDVPIKNYSSGMKARLGFSIATLVSPDILILDEVLSVGDAKFRKKSEKKVLSMFDKGVTVLFVSHSLEQVQRLCNKAMILEKGKLIAYGDIDEISAKYAEMIR